MTTREPARYGACVSMLVVRTLVLAVFGCVLGYAVNALRADGVALAPMEAPHACGVPTERSSSVLVLSAADAASAIDAGGLVVFDARAAADYERGHVDGALHLPCTSASHDAERLLAPARAGTEVIVYGDGLDDARPMAEEIVRRVGGDVRIAVVDGGYDALVAAGAAAESGSCERCGTSGAFP